MKKFFILLLAIISLFTFSACKEQAGLERYVSELRSDVFYGESQDLTVKGGYGFKEIPYSNDGKVGTCGHFLTFKLIGKETSLQTFTASFNFNEQKYSASFIFNPITHSLVATIEIENFNLKEFDLDITCGNKVQTVKMKSTLPANTIDYVKALSCLEQSQPQLIKAFSDSEGNFNAEIYIRIIVKNDKAFWYVGLAGGNDLLKALLIDGASGEVLAIREII